jgi:hypothetical protein
MPGEAYRAITKEAFTTLPVEDQLQRVASLATNYPSLTKRIIRLNHHTRWIRRFWWWWYRVKV